MTLMATIVLLAAPTAQSQVKGKPAPEEQTGLKVGAKAPKSALFATRPPEARPWVCPTQEGHQYGSGPTRLDLRESK